MSGKDGDTPHVVNENEQEDKKEKDNEGDRQPNHGDEAGGGGGEQGASDGNGGDGTDQTDTGNGGAASGEAGDPQSGHVNAYAFFDQVDPAMASDHNFMASLLSIMADYHKRKAEASVKAEPGVHVPVSAPTNPLFSAIPISTVSPTSAHSVNPSTINTSASFTSAVSAPVTNATTRVVPSTVNTTIIPQSFPHNNIANPAMNIAAATSLQNLHGQPFGATTVYPSPFFGATIPMQQPFQLTPSLMSTTVQPSMLSSHMQSFPHHPAALGLHRPVVSTPFPSPLTQQNNQHGVNASSNNDQSTTVGSKFKEIIRIVGHYNSATDPSVWIYLLEDAAVSQGLTTTDLVNHVKILLEDSKDKRVKQWFTEVYMNTFLYNKASKLPPEYTWESLKQQLIKTFNIASTMEKALEQMNSYVYTNETAEQFVHNVTALVRKLVPSATDDVVIYHLYQHLPIDMRARMVGGGKHASIDQFEASLRIVIEAKKAEAKASSLSSGSSVVSTHPGPAVRVLNQGVCHFCSKGPHKAEDCYTFNRVATILMKEDRNLTFNMVYQALINKGEYTSAAITNYFANPAAYLSPPRQDQNTQQGGWSNNRGGRGGQRRGFYRRGGNNNNNNANRAAANQGAAQPNPNNNNNAEN